jgi:hypothetical protein
MALGVPFHRRGRIADDAPAAATLSEHIDRLAWGAEAVMPLFNR